MKANKTFQDSALLVLRIVVAVIFAYAAYAKFGIWSVQSGDMPPVMLNIMRLLSIVEPLGAAAVLVGVLTRWAALGLAIIMVGAIYVLQFTMHVGFATAQGSGWNFPLMVAAGCVILMAFGAGGWSVDAMWKKA